MTTEESDSMRRMLVGLCSRIYEMAQWEDYPKPDDVLGLIAEDPELTEWLDRNLP